MDRTGSSLAHAWSATTMGIDAIPVEVEVHVRSGLPSYTVVGLPQATVRESRDRVLSALRASGLPIPRGAITVNLAPADVRKEGALFDLPLAAALLAAQSAIPSNGRVRESIAIGELALDGRIRPVRGALSVAMAAAAHGMKSVVVPAENTPEASVVDGLSVHGVSTLAEAAAVFRGLEDGTCAARVPRLERPAMPDMADVIGQAGARRALEIAAAGHHNVLLVGPPGAGKTMLARRLPGILPPLTRMESLETSRVHSVAGLLDPARGLLRDPPFRAPHHSVTTAGMIGGGDPPRPGEVSLAHHGVLFLDELPEFARGVLEALRQPMEDQRLTLARARWRVALPARFLLVGSMNPCPCGRAGTGGCTCDPGRVARYLGRVSGPIRDRIDMHVHVDAVAGRDWHTGRGESSHAMRTRVQRARARRIGRGSDDGAFSTSARRLFGESMDRLGLSARAVVGVRRMARTIADLDGRDTVTADHVAEAVQYRTLDRRLLAA